MFRNILHIDDDEDDCMMFLAALETLDIPRKYTALHDAQQALEALANSQSLPDIIFLDYNMPKMNGIEFLRKFKNLKFSMEIPVIMFSTSSRDDLIKLSMGLGVSNYITKPQDFGDLKKLLRELI